MKMPRQLQWGHVFSDVEIKQIRFGIGLRSAASMGPRLFRRGNHTYPANIDSFICASMGPRLFRRGNIAVSVSLWLAAHDASMGPRLFRRGNALNVWTIPAQITKLQWGHVFSDVEIRTV